MDLWALIESGKPFEKIQQPILNPQDQGYRSKRHTVVLLRFDYHEGCWELAGGKQFYVKDRGAKLPVALGHEILGNIVKGEPDARDQPVVIRRIVFPWLGCGSCPRCAWEEDNMCTSQ